MNGQARFSGYAGKLRKAFPSWTKIRKDPKSVGAQFLSVFGVELDDVEWMLRYAYEQAYIGSADINQADVVYKARVPNSLTKDMEYRYIINSGVLLPVETEEKFLSSLNEQGRHKILQRDTLCYTDFEKKVVYVKLPFDKDEEHPYGKVTLEISTESGESIIDTLPLILHPVWNFFDEFGLLLGEPRAPGERNAEYKERLLDVFRRPASSTKEGLRNGIARGLGLIQKVEWLDGTLPLTLRHAQIDITTITVDGVPYDPEELLTDVHGRIVIPAGDSGTHEVRYISGISLHELHDKEDAEFQKELFNIDGTASDKLIYYTEKIRDRVPAMWGQFRWGESHWDVSDESYAGFSFIPTLYDGRTDGYRKEDES